MKKIISCFLLLAFFFSANTFAQERIVSIGGTLTEILFELGMGDKLVAIDATSIYPQDKTKDIKNLGYKQSISMEGIVSLNPDLVLASSKLAPKKLLQDLKKLKVNVVVVEEKDSFESAKNKISIVAKSVSKVNQGKALIANLEKDFQKARQTVSDENEKKLIFIYARGGNRVFLSGAKTAAHEMMTLAGAQNAFSQVEGFKPITTESLIKGNPDAIVMLKSGMESLKDPWSAIKGIEHTNAGKNKKIIVVDDSAFLGFGPRSAKELLSLSEEVKKI